MAGRVIKEAGDDRTAQIVRAWRIALGRTPSDEESMSANKLLDELEQSSPTPLKELPDSLKSVPPARAQALAKLCLALFNLSEFAFID